jgi:hypothetical protein
VNGATVVTLQAAGGTMPLYIEDNEVHELFGVSQSTMVNTYDKQAKAPVIFRLKNRYNDIKDIPVRVNDVILPAEVGKLQGNCAARLPVSGLMNGRTLKSSIRISRQQWKTAISIGGSNQ